VGIEVVCKETAKINRTSILKEKEEKKMRKNTYKKISLKHIYFGNNYIYIPGVL
jgi:hypothetical protein